MLLSCMMSIDGNEQQAIAFYVLWMDIEGFCFGIPGTFLSEWASGSFAQIECGGHCGWYLM